MLELYIYNQEDSSPVKISKRQFELVDRTNARETSIIRFGDSIRTVTAVFKDGKIVSIYEGPRYSILDGEYCLDDGGISTKFEDTPVIEEICLACGFPSEHFFAVEIIERLD